MAELAGWLIYAREDYIKNASFAQRFLNLGNNSMSSLKLIIREELFIGIANGMPRVFSKEGEPLRLPDYAVNRTIDPLLSKQLEALGVKVYNSSSVSEICNDKARTYLEVSRLGLPMVDTLFVSKQALLDGGIPISFPVVLKTVDGRGGSEVFLVKTDEEARSIVLRLQKERYVVQKLCGSPGRDVRVFAVGKNIIGAVLRSSQGDFKANFSLGGTAAPYILNDEERCMAQRIIDHFDFGMAGIDFIFDEHGRFLFNEIEDVAGSRTLSMTSDIDIVRLYLEHIYRESGLSI